MIKQSKMNVLILMLTCLTQDGYADSCTPPSTAVDPLVESKVSYDKKAKAYKYQYTLKNGANAQIPIEWFRLILNQKPQSTGTPLHWNADFTALSFAPFSLDWGTFEPDPAIANKITNDATLAVPIYAIKPKGSLSGFEITSPQPPGPVQFFVEGFTQIPAGTPTAQNDEPVPNCPGWDFSNSPYEATQVNGMTTGPLDPGTISVRLRAREEHGRKPHGGINPKKPEGKLAVLVFSTRNFDASQINVSSLQFGPGYAGPTSSRLVPSGEGEKIEGDERVEWEQSLEESEPEIADRKNAHPKNLLLIFDVSALDVQCHLDQALFLRGQTNSGEHVVGAVPSRVVGCDPHEIGVHKKHSIRFKWWSKAQGAR